MSPQGCTRTSSPLTRGTAGGECDSGACVILQVNSSRCRRPPILAAECQAQQCAPMNRDRVSRRRLLSAYCAHWPPILAAECQAKQCAPMNQDRRIHPKKQRQVNEVQAAVGHGRFVYVSAHQANSATCQAVLCPAQQTTNQHAISMQPPCEQAPTSMACASGAMSSE